MNLHIRLILILLGLFFFCCQKIEVTPEEQIMEDVLVDCTNDYSAIPINIDEEFYPFTCIQLYLDVTYINPGNYQYPVFNPNNLNQIAFLGWDTPYWVDKLNLYKFDFCSGGMEKILDSVFPRSIDWSSKDWILYLNPEDAKIWKVKSNGDSLTQVSFQGVCSYPSWNEEGTQFAYLKSIDNDDRIIIANENGEVLDSIDENIIPYSFRWQEGYITYASGYFQGLAFYNTDTKEIEFTYENQDSLNLGNPIFIKQSNQILLNGHHIVLLDIATGLKDTIYSGADNRGVNVSDIIEYEDNLYLLNTRTNTIQISTCAMEQDLELSLINPATGVERIILLPD